MTDDPRTRSRRPLGHTAGVVLWWLAALVIAPPAATVTSGLLTGLDGTCYPGPTRLDCLFLPGLAVAVAVPAVVIGALWAGARALARGDRGPASGDRMVRAHVAVVAVLITAYVAAAVATRLDDYGSVGGSLLLAVGGMPLLDLGLPWSLAHLPSLKLPGAWGDVADVVTTVVPALLNVAVHAAARRAWRDRSGLARAHSVG